MDGALLAGGTGTSLDGRALRPLRDLPHAADAVLPGMPVSTNRLADHLRFGTVFSYTVVRRAITPEMVDTLPYVPALIDRDGAPGARLTAAIIGVPVSAIRIGLRVRVVWHDRSDQVTVPRLTFDSLA